MSSRPSSKAVLGEGVEGEAGLDAGGRGFQAEAFEVDGDFQRRVGLTASSRALPTSGETCTGTSPALVELLRKMSPKRGEITAWKP